MTVRHGPELPDVDPFDLPDWLSSGPVVWESDGGLRAGHHVTGTVTGEDGDQLPCALLAVDEAYPAPVAGDDVRTRAHQAWHHRQVLLVERAGIHDERAGVGQVQHPTVGAVERQRPRIRGANQRHPAWQVLQSQHCVHHAAIVCRTSCVLMN